MPRTPQTSADKARIARQAYKNFKQWNETGQPEVLDDNGRVIHKIRGEIFLESPKLSEIFGKHRYYISSRGRLISFATPNHPKLITPRFFRNDPSEREKYRVNTRGLSANEYIHRLVAEAFTAYHYGLATVDDEVHHERGYLKNRGIFFNNNPKYLEYVTAAVHDLLDKIQRSRADERTVEEEIEIMKTLSCIAGIEEPDNITVITQDVADKNFVTIQAITNEKAKVKIELSVRAEMCTAFLNEQNLEDDLKFVVHTEYNGHPIIAGYEYDHKKRKSHLISVEKEPNIKNLIETADYCMKGFFSMFDMLTDKQQEP